MVIFELANVPAFWIALERSSFLPIRKYNIFELAENRSQNPDSEFLACAARKQNFFSHRTQRNKRRAITLMNFFVKSWPPQTNTAYSGEVGH
jgi:hypothetical protein